MLKDWSKSRNNRRGCISLSGFRSRYFQIVNERLLLLSYLKVLSSSYLMLYKAFLESRLSYGGRLEDDTLYAGTCRSRWPHDRRHIFVRWTLGSCVRIPLEASMSMHLCCPVCVCSALAMDCSSVQGVLPTVYGNPVQRGARDILFWRPP
jgi:hypothetical protein